MNKFGRGTNTDGIHVLGKKHCWKLQSVLVLLIDVYYNSIISIYMYFYNANRHVVYILGSWNKTVITNLLIENVV